MSATDADWNILVADFHPTLSAIPLRETGTTHWIKISVLLTPLVLQLLQAVMREI